MSFDDQRLDRHMHPAHRARHFKVLSKLSSASGRFPECLVLKGIEIEGHPVARGGYGDVYVGLLYGKTKIAVKTLRIYQDSDMTELLKVLAELFVFGSSLLNDIARASQLRQSYGGSCHIPMYCPSTVFSIWREDLADFA
jgi:hypothetical protein